MNFLMAFFFNDFLQDWLTGNQSNRVKRFRYNNQDDGVSFLFRGSKWIRDVKYLWFQLNEQRIG